MMPTCKIHYKETEMHDVIPMRALKPLEQARIVAKTSASYGHIIMRTAAESRFEVMDLTDFRPGGCWAIELDINVKLLKHPLTITLSND